VSDFFKKIRSGSVEVPLATATNEVFVAKIEDAIGLRKRLREITPKDDEFRMAFENARVAKGNLPDIICAHLKWRRRVNQRRGSYPRMIVRR
jgi:hypothetical protein